MRVPARVAQPFAVLAPNARETDSVPHVSSSRFPLSPPQIPLLPADAFAAGLVCQGPRVSVSTISLRLPGEYVSEKCQIDLPWVVSPQCAPSSSVLLCFEIAQEHRVPVSWRSGWRSRVR